MLNTIYIRTFLAVVDAGNYTAAAEHLHMSQPAVSQHIRALEEQLGDVRLFRRVGQRMVTTHAGEELLKAARELVDLAERTEQNIRSLRGQVSGRVTVGCTPSSGEYILPTLLATFRQFFPSVSLTLQVSPGDVLLDGLVAQHITLIFLEEHQRRRGWESHLLGQEGITLLAPRSHPLLSEEEVPPGVLRDEPLVLPPIGAPLRRTIDDGLRRRGVLPADVQVAVECDSVTMAVQYVRAGVGLAFIPDICMVSAPDLEKVALAGSPLRQEWYVLRQRTRNLSRAAYELHTFMTSGTALSILLRNGLQPPG